LESWYAKKATAMLLSGISFTYSPSHTCQSSKTHHWIDQYQIYRMICNSLLYIFFFEIRHNRRQHMPFPINYLSSLFMFKCMPTLKSIPFDRSHLVLSNVVLSNVIISIFQLLHLNHFTEILLIECIHFQFTLRYVPMFKQLPFHRSHSVLSNDV
jgi:hypothetical protein